MIQQVNEMIGTGVTLMNTDMKTKRVCGEMSERRRVHRSSKNKGKAFSVLLE